jgi:hypothetical protein
MRSTVGPPTMLTILKNRTCPEWWAAYRFKEWTVFRSRVCSGAQLVVISTISSSTETTATSMPAAISVVRSSNRWIG